MSQQTHLTLKDVDGITSAEELEALKSQKGIHELCPNAKLALERRGILATADSE